MGLLVVSVQNSQRKKVQTASLPSRNTPGTVRGWDLRAQVGRHIVPVGILCEGLVPRSPVCDSNLSMKSDSRVCPGSTQELQTPLYGPFCKPGRGFLPSAENLVQNLPPLLSRNVVIFSWVYLRPGYAGDQVNSMAKQEKAISRIYGQALNYHVESKWSQGYKYKRQISSGIAMSLLLLDTPRAFSATRPGNQELLETPYLPNFSPISIYPCIPGAVLASGAGELFLSNNPFLGTPSASAAFTIQHLSPLGHKGFDMCCTNDVCLRNQIWSSERDPFIFSHAISLHELCYAVLSPPADIPSLLCPGLQVPESWKGCLKGSSTVMRSAREHIQPA